ncbi:Karyogamy protein KAR9 [Candida viswanathii]|uniref:Karyogamy protein KAR9 n=1 Tax=Candida viswanathii TaxID=5486 RepID=A0A367YCQ0_9ASCO|nr:Karyogamy protein KAR9 [Candida viswanathii]
MSTNGFLSNGNRQLMLRNPPTVQLSHILSSIPEFSFFDELIHIPQPLPTDSSTVIRLLQRDVFDITKILDDINLYLNDVTMIFNNVQQGSKHVVDLLNWYFEGKAPFLELLRNIDSIDSIISQLLLVIESSDVPDNVSASLLGTFEEISDLLLEVKKALIVFKKYIDISVNYRELIDSVIKSLSNEIEDCVKCILKLKELKLASPKKVLPEYTLESITAKMKVNDLTNGSFSFKSMRLPTFSDLDEKLYNDYLELESKIDPLRTAIGIVPLRIDEFNTMCSGHLFVKSRETVLATYEVLVNKWNLLLKEKNTFKKDNINVKWNEIFGYLIDEICKECEALVKGLNARGIKSLVENPSSAPVITDEMGAMYKMCSNTITLIQKAFKESIISDHELATIFNHDLVPKWDEVNEAVANNGKAKQQKRLLMYVNTNTIESNGLRLFQTGSRNSTVSSHEGPLPVSNGLGIDFNVEVEATTVPLSVEKSNRVKDVASAGAGLEQEPSRGRSLRHSLISVFEDNGDHDDEDEVTTLVKSPKVEVAKELEEQQLERRVNTAKQELVLSTLSIPQNDTTKSIDFAAFFESISSSSLKTDSRLPKVAPDLIRRGYSTIQKKPGSEKSRIPGASRSRSLCGSPVSSNRNLFLKQNSAEFGSYVSPLRNKRGSAYFSGRSRASSNATVIGRPNSLLNEMKVPNLNYAKRLSYNLEGLQEDGLTSFESRFDEENLLQALRETSIWK